MKVEPGPAECCKCEPVINSKLFIVLLFPNTFAQTAERADQTLLIQTIAYNSACNPPIGIYGAKAILTLFRPVCAIYIRIVLLTDIGFIYLYLLFRHIL